MPDTQQFCTFYLDPMLFGIEVEKVQEVLRSQPITHVPLAPKVVQGLINLRGQIVTAVDLRRLLELPAPPQDLAPMNIIVRTDDGAFSLLVDRIGDVMELERTCSEPPPENLRGMARLLTESTYKLDGALLLAMDVDKVVAPETLNRAMSATREGTGDHAAAPAALTTTAAAAAIEATGETRH